MTGNGEHPPPQAVPIIALHPQAEHGRLSSSAEVDVPCAAHTQDRAHAEGLPGQDQAVAEAAAAAL